MISSHRGVIKFIANGAGVADHTYVCEKNSADAYVWVAIGSDIGGYAYREPVTITNAGSSLTVYQVSLTVDTSSLIAAGKMRSDCGDIRFTDIDGVTLLNYWLESGCNTTTTKLWVQVPVIPSGSDVVYLYYGNRDATSASSGDNTFLLFDHFDSALDTNKWTTGYFVHENSAPFASLNGGFNTPDTTTSYLRFTGTRSSTDSATEDGVNSGWWGRSVISKNGISETNFVVEASMWFTQSSSGTYVNQYEPMIIGVGLNKDNYIWGTGRFDNAAFQRREVGGALATSGSVGHTFAQSTWYRIKYTYVDNNNCTYTAGSDSVAYSVGQALSTRKVYMAFDHRAPSATATQYVDFVFVRKYSVTEPTATVGSEEHGDIAEWYKIDPGCAAAGNCPEGADIVAVNGSGFIEKSSQPYQPGLMGVISTEPKEILGPGNETDSRPLALIGNVPVRVSAKNGKITAGDYLTSSDLPGVAMKAAGFGEMIGKALDSYDGDGIGTVRVFVDPQFAFQLSESGTIDTATSTEEATSTSPLANSMVYGPFSLAIKSILDGFGLFVENGIATLKEIVVEKLTADNADIKNIKTQNFEITDSDTGEVYCVGIKRRMGQGEGQVRATGTG